VCGTAETSGAAAYGKRFSEKISLFASGNVRSAVGGAKNCPGL
jgi:hypothetical protein